MLLGATTKAQQFKLGIYLMRYTELAFTGPATFFKAPYRPLTEPWQAEVGLLGLPYDFAVGYRPGARFAPNALREASGRYAPGPEGWFDLETETYRLQGVHLVDAGDVDPAQLEYHETFRRITEAARALRAGRGTARPLQPLIELTGGRLLFEAEAEATDWRHTEPYTFRELTYRLRGVGPDAGATFRIWVKNEHHAVWRDSAVIATSPDIIALLDAESLRPLTTLGDVTPGRRVIAFAMKAMDSQWHTPAGLALLGPRHFGLDFDYVPFDRAATA
ncbi:arginase family protein [Meiothermus ruber]|uniref:S-methyl thiohydantoin desulfurase domain-containing protein n=1 Tax=Meiothermus ruber TaxID=277 RepID=UPI0023F65267|nr:arginase family protein [Meiothermus ruber]